MEIRCNVEAVLWTVRKKAIILFTFLSLPSSCNASRIQFPPSSRELSEKV
jgi:hypothetical protein